MLGFQDADKYLHDRIVGELSLIKADARALVIFFVSGNIYLVGDLMVDTMHHSKH